MVDPDQAEAIPIVYKVVVANPLAASPKRTSVEGLVVKISEGQDVITLKPDGENTKHVSVRSVHEVFRSYAGKSGGGTAQLVLPVEMMD